MSRPFQAAAVFLLAFLSLAFRLSESGIATNYVDPVAKILAQDEAVYASTALGMAGGDGWLTPKFLGRYAFYKPPLLYWLSGASVKALGRSAFALRLPSLVAGAGVAALLFLWASATGSLVTGWIAVFLLIGDRSFHALGRTALMDTLLLLWIVVALYALHRDSSLARYSSAVVFGVATGAAILTKAIGGLLPLIVLGVFWVFSPRSHHPPFRRIVPVVLTAAAVALPWYVYQWIAHPRWLWAEYVLTELLGFGVGSPAQTTQENQILYYVKRLWLLDPALCMLALAVLPWWLARLRERKSAESALAAAWCAVAFAVLLAFQYRNTSYLLPLATGLCLLVAQFMPRRGQAVSLCLAVGVLAGKTCFPAQPWGVFFGPESINASAAALEDYCGQHRGNDLIVVEPDDEFYSADLPLARVRYSFFEPAPNPRKYALAFDYLGVTVTETQFEAMDQWGGIFLGRLRDWGLLLPDESSPPIATVVLVRSREEISRLIATHPDGDFSLPRGMLSEVELGTAHDRWQPSTQRIYLLSRTARRYDPRFACHL